MNQETPHSLLLHCRAGFEKECAAEIQAQAQDLEVLGYAKTRPGSGHVLFTPYEERDMNVLSKDLHFADLCFARQMLFVLPLLEKISPTDRISPLLEAARSLAERFSDLFLETADTNEAKELSVFVRKFSGPFSRAMQDAGMLATSPKAPRLHLFFIDSTTVYVGLSRPGNSSPWTMGIPRLKFPRSAPSRSTLKLEEAFLFFLGEDPRSLQPGMKAVDLGAAPGGWTWQLVKRSLRVTAVDNGPMDKALLDSGIVEHLRTDGFRYRPPKPVDWLVCDMVEQPARIAQLVARWLAEGDCRQALFNLKLPMKKRYEEMKRCRNLIEIALDDAEIPFRLSFKQLYHDREEITGYLVRLS
ncbi:MAG: 23S rRNA (cytidine(2498)-2'-O)-methyltransferase RlmM [Methylococcaceae bacterium]|nr:23S rRNA (cytidine(2498)-2'-O)-methyltransferase RlmM [Methylococcaceae bacterium]